MQSMCAFLSKSSHGFPFIGPPCNVHKYCSFHISTSIPGSPQTNPFCGCKIYENIDVYDISLGKGNINAMYMMCSYLQSNTIFHIDVHFIKTLLISFYMHAQLNQLSFTHLQPHMPGSKQI